MSRLEKRVERLEDSLNPLDGAEVQALYHRHIDGLQRVYGDSWKAVHDRLVEQAKALPDEVDLIALLMLGPDDCHVITPRLTVGRLAGLGLI